MDEIERIKLLNELRDGNETLLFTKALLKYLDMKNGKIEKSISEIDELIVFFEQRDQFEICEFLIKLKNESI